ncbi:MAG: tetratricopeptide repeat-containing sensor histidine kinase [Bacteroidales bacterium]|nr:tetratricopeptide repeat-containing sensor histidine kinase [Bacteroidales bacterium]
MKIKAIYLLIFLSPLISLNILSQNNIIIDSLKSEIKKSTDIQNKIDLDMQLCWILRNQNPEEAMFYGNSAIATIEANKLDKNYSQAFNYLGVVHRNKGEYNYALDLYKQALKWAIKTDNIIQTAYAYNNIGGIYTLTNSYPEAIESIEKAKKIFEKENNTKGIGYTSVNLGNLYRHLKSFEKSMYYFNEAEKIKTQLNDTIGLTVIKQLKADILKEQGKLDEAERFLRELKLEYIHNKDIKGQAIVTNELGLIEMGRGNNSLAIKLYLEAEKINKSIQNRQGLAYNNINLGLAYSNINKFKIALNKIKRGYEIGSALGDKRTILMTQQAFVKVYEKQKNWKEAYKAQKKYLKTYSELYNFEQSEQIKSIRDKYENEKYFIEQKLLEEKNANLEQEFTFTKTKYNYLKISGFFTFIFLLALSVIFFFYQNKVKESKNASNLISQQNEKLKEANTTKEQFLSIIGHDLKNPFNSVLGLSNLIIDQWKSLDDEERFQISNEINSSSQSIYELLDNLLIWSRTQSSNIIKSPEFFDLNEAIKDVFEIFKNQAKFKNINVRLELKGQKNVYADSNMIGTVIRNLLSNALKFTHENGQIVILTQQKDDMVEFSISDNGKGILPDDLKRIFEDKGHKTTKGTANETGSGLGLLLAKDFIQQNNGLIWVESKPGKGSLFTFTLPTS